MHFMRRVGGYWLFVLYWYELLFCFVVLACLSLHVSTVCIWPCKHAGFRVEFLYASYIHFYSFIDVMYATLRNESYY